MLRTNKGTKKNKQGILLLTILFIMAIALIFIASALMLTTATRMRLYTRAEDNQARLTVTSVAESFYQALYMQQITDADIQSMSGTTVEFTNPDVPGMGGVEGNRTIAIFSYNSTTQAVTIDFKTTIDDQTECIKMVLKYEEPKVPRTSFKHVVNIADGGTMDRLTIGQGAPEDVTNNTLLFRGGSLSDSSLGNNHIYSRAILTGGFYQTDSQFYDDVVFLGWDSYAELSVGYQGIQTNNGADVYFINNALSFRYNDSPVDSLQRQFVQSNGGESAVILYNDSAHPQYAGRFKDQNFNGLPLYYYGTTFDTADTINGMTELTSGSEFLNASVGYGETDVSSINRLIETYQLTDDNGDPKLDDDGNPIMGQYDLYTWNGVYTNITRAFAEADRSMPSVYGGSTINAGDYVSNGGTASAHTLNVGTISTAAQSITFDVSDGSIYFVYIPNRIDIRGNAVISVEHTSGAWGDVYLFLDPEATIHIGSDQVCGIISEGTVPHCTIYSMGSDYCGSTADTATIAIDAGNNDNYLQAYIGLFETNTGAGDNGTMYSHKMDSVKFYGRIACGGIYNNNSGGNFIIPYCPEPGADDSSGDASITYSSYRVYDFQYYSE